MHHKQKRETWSLPGSPMKSFTESDMLESGFDAASSLYHYSNAPGIVPVYTNIRHDESYRSFWSWPDYGHDTKDPKLIIRFPK